ncbi:bifunctional UDP-N-acetylglucosamine diphosphorylase/glucosamine-1-phosphate N-acetyltransferase GlmU [Peribacillus frigoritolerans]|jgi:bifunctional UDP-N-acetylglucosamine pyrophosphorylase/glucosamine-1-phosphate N-acetyltransferase|uniref:bifunctional UDP-N-acetylglucosamine diphosphorylase/glucosamine-1-phosphate N-acetyltransferase GlmU n=1 Tax=Peribacillus frigoritolerans TaxID=450367 RepID=UPI00070C5DE8|nr:bifunctional UDP-N-acetylglucosamine diphosphorylase/glucosamine-1-phosphate N-acetyltransferase GlmU [Peribacillus frigoritolerans]KRF58311.1 bifunctional N-acetylglucosamine-1-phosphate uridyltransferase/glucosamine-1-phosphate acetyltransferase [Bacillus sp. Soil745]MBT2604753.1 bifunctional UDP-N-acetylglucosamine diphosphorylase/glucosamine-1-phosphate N-acetyltransferase GlmU [Bacillus sp. ISL-53]PAW26554.1 bifunctional N-acetylglucosamine-1-phosphate uridyltransferase/glucosamine-1-pho
MSNRYAIILAAGQGTRMKSKLYKVLHPVCGKPMVQHVIDQVNQLQIEDIVTVIGHGAEKVQDQLGDSCKYALQEQQLGTAHAVMQAESVLSAKSGTTLVICGDTPLIKAETMKELIALHEQSQAKATILTAYADNPAGYGRVLRGEGGLVEKIVEHKDASEEERYVKEINTGTYCFDNQALFSALKKVSNENVQGEYYLPDVIEILKEEGEVVTAFQSSEFEETLGVNDRVALSQAEQILRKRINEKHMRNGVTIIDPLTTFIEADVQIGQDTVINPGSFIKGKSIIGQDCLIGPNTEISNCEIGDGTEVLQSVVHESSIGSFVKIGPFAHVRPQSDIKDSVKIGNFVEIKKTVFGKGSKASHLSYIGDAEVGENVNIGCGSITVNYDGKNKYLTKIEDNVFIGCNSNLVAPVTVGEGAYVAAGSTITEDVPQQALSVARARQVNKEDYVKNLKFNK